ncbi:MAG: ECF transporter S component [bacterium]
MRTERIRTIGLVTVGLLIALTTVGTMAIRIPVPATAGYINFGDTVIFIAALLFGGWVGGIVGGIGSSLADLLGYPVYALPTLIIKGLEGFIAGGLFHLFGRSIGTRRGFLLAIPSVVLGFLWMVLGYFVAEIVLLSAGFIVTEGGEAPLFKALTEVPGNLIQGGVSGGVALAVSVALYKAIGGERLKLFAWRGEGE